MIHKPTLLLCFVALFSVPIAAPRAQADTFHYTVTADPRWEDATYDGVLAAMQTLIGGQGVFQISVGDIDPLQPLRDKVDARFGANALWYPVVGNHEAETSSDMTWIRDEYTTGNGLRTPLSNATNQNGPAGSVETTYSWDHGNAHFIVLNEYWNGETAAGSDVATDGDIVQALYDWLAADLAANTQPFVFVFGHEPAFPFHRHLVDSLNKYEARRDAFWNLLESYGVHAYFCGHTHFYSRHREPGGTAWQIDAATAGYAAFPDFGGFQTFVDVVVGDVEVRYDVYNNAGGTWHIHESWTEPAVPMRVHTLGAEGVFRRVHPNPMPANPTVATKVHFGATTNADTFFAVDVLNEKHYFYDGSFGNVFTITPGTLQQVAGYGNLTDLWSDNVARVPDFLIAWDPDGDGDDEVWAFLGSDYYVFDWNAQQFGLAQPLSNLGASGLTFQAMVKYGSSTSMDNLIAFDGDLVYVYNPTSFPLGLTYLIGDVTPGGSTFEPELAVTIDRNLDNLDDLYAIDLETNAVWDWNRATDQFELNPSSFSSHWPNETVPLDPSNGDFIFSFKSLTGPSLAKFFAIQHP